MVYGVASNLLPNPGDRPENVYLCGQWVPPSSTWTPPPALAHFLNAEEAPVFIGFGSMSGLHSPLLPDVLIEAMAGRRAMFFPGWSAIGPRRLPSNFLAIGDTPHDWLFPRTAAVFLHGGPGTSHSAARAAYRP